MNRDQKKRPQYEECKAGLRIVHETQGAGVIVRRTAGLVWIRPDDGDYDVLALPVQLRPQLHQWRGQPQLP